MTDRVGVKVAYLDAGGQVATSASYAMGVCTMHGENAVGTIEFYDSASTPSEGATPKCKIDVVTKGVFSVMIPQPGALFEKGIYVKVPDDSSINFFYKDA